MKPLRVGITGNIGAGKSAISRIFSYLGVPVYEADQRARALMEQDPELITALKTRFGASVFQEDGHLNRSWLAERIFADEDARSYVQARVHPAVGRDFEHWVTTLDAPYCINEAALLIESGRYRRLDHLILVTAPQQLRLQRVMARDGATEAAVRARMERQMPEIEKRAYADDIMVNDGHQPLIPQVLDRHRQFMKRTAS